MNTLNDLFQVVGIIILVSMFLLVGVRVLDGDDHRLGTIEIGRSK